MIFSIIILTIVFYVTAAINFVPFIRIEKGSFTIHGAAGELALTYRNDHFGMIVNNEGPVRDIHFCFQSIIDIITHEGCPRGMLRLNVKNVQQGKNVFKWTSDGHIWKTDLLARITPLLKEENTSYIVVRPLAKGITVQFTDVDRAVVTQNVQIATPDVYMLLWAWCCVFFAAYSMFSLLWKFRPIEPPEIYDSPRQKGMPVAPRGFKWVQRAN